MKKIIKNNFTGMQKTYYFFIPIYVLLMISFICCNENVKEEEEYISLAPEQDILGTWKIIATAMREGDNNYYSGNTHYEFLPDKTYKINIEGFISHQSFYTIDSDCLVLKSMNPDSTYSSENLWMYHFFENGEKIILVHPRGLIPKNSRFNEDIYVARAIHFLRIFR